MTRKLPWLQGDTTRVRSSFRSATPSCSKRPRPILDSSDVELPLESGKSKGTGSRTTVREVFVAPLHEPPEEIFMIDGFSHDDRYRMVEDEFLEVAKEYTQHLHAAEYQRMKNAAKTQNAATINSISRQVTTKLEGQTKRKVESMARAKKQADAIYDIHGDQPRDSGDDSDETQGPWLGTALQGLMEKPRASAMPLTNISGFQSASKAAAGYKGSLIGQMDNYDAPNLEEPGLSKPTTTAVDPYVTENSESQDDDDDLAAVPMAKRQIR